MVIYLGHAVEIGSRDAIFRDPLHPYTRALLSATPVADPGVKRERIILTGEPPSPLAPPPGCPFNPRCPLAFDRCRSEEPPDRAQTGSRRRLLGGRGLMMSDGRLFLPADGRQSETALMIARGARRLLRARGFSSLTELPLIDGRRADIVAVNAEGEVLIIEIKSSPADLRADRKWRDYAACCDRLYFAISEHTPAGIAPADAGLILADPYGAEIVREAEIQRMAPSSRRALRCASPKPQPTGCTVSRIREGRGNFDRQCDISTGSDCCRMQIEAHAAEQALEDPRMAEGAGDDEIGVLRIEAGEQRFDRRRSPVLVQSEICATTPWRSRCCTSMRRRRAGRWAAKRSRRPSPFPPS